MGSVEELAHYFVYEITKARIGIEGRLQSAYHAITKLLEKGWTLQEIKEELDQFARDYPQIILNVYHVEEIMAKKEPPNNLLQADIFYYHNILREVSPPVKIAKDPKTGQLIRQSHPFFLEMKRRFTMKDLLNYWYEQMDIAPSEHLIRQDEGKFKYMLSNYTLDEILFAIDVAKTIRKEQQLRPLRNAFDLEKYIEDAREFIRAKENIHRLQGINREFKRHDTNCYH